MTKVFLTRRFRKSFEKLDIKTQARVRDVILSLEDKPEEGKRLSGDLAGEYALRVGTYRILYMIEGDDIIVETVRHRRDVYKRR